MKILICGGRHFSDYDFLVTCMNELNQRFNITAIISGRCRGADLLGERWAINNEIPIIPFPANWKKYGVSAGQIRNQQMIDEGKPDLCIAFPGNNGTADMIRRCRYNKIPVEQFPKTNIMLF